ncbi:TPA: aldo/keto reductase [Legionella pneumophila]|nr:aldo/keto reductase [Legionella pneumophila]HEL3599865.1 aldo/keto reductase [Legionella pneumophila]HEL7844224.1 aldo/keto reductase [Legionella pneumophila]
MIDITVTYFLNAAGKMVFQHWFDKVAYLTRQQDGFISITNELDGFANPLVHLKFENQAKLNIWASSQQHDNLVLEIEKYFIKPQEAKFMEQRRIGKNGPLVSAIGLGCMGMSMGYGPGDDAQSIKVIHRAIDLGVTLIDTADMYGWGHNEELISKAIKTQRHKITLATKMGFARRDKGGTLDYCIDGSPAYVKEACDASLKRLGVEEIDLYYLHRVDSKTPIEESIGAMADLVKAGKIRHIGISEVKPSTIRRAAKVHAISAVQTEYSLWERYPENEIIPTCQELGIGFVAYSPLGRGFLTGEVSDVSKLSTEDFRPLLPRFQGENFVANQKLILKLKEMAEIKKCSLSQLALAWILAQPANIIPIPGTKRMQYLEDNLGALNLKLSQEDLDKLERIFPVNVAKGNKYPKEFDSEA